MSDDLDKFMHYRRRAAEIVSIAEKTKDPAARALLFTIADDYLRMVGSLERLREKTPGAAAPPPESGTTPERTRPGDKKRGKWGGELEWMP